jgi:hypothetical protein
MNNGDKNHEANASKMAKSSIHPIIMIVYYIIFNSLSWLSIVFGMLSKAVKGQ